MPRTLLFPGDQPLGTDTLPPALLDTTPDAWGQMLLSRERGRLLGTWELLVGVSDETRMGALRVGATDEGPFLHDGDRAVPPMTSLRELQDLARRVEEDPDAEIEDQRLRDLVALGSSLGGARPKRTSATPTAACGSPSSRRARTAASTSARGSSSTPTWRGERASRSPSTGSRQ